MKGILELYINMQVWFGTRVVLDCDYDIRAEKKTFISIFLHKPMTTNSGNSKRNVMAMVMVMAV